MSGYRTLRLYTLNPTETIAHASRAYLARGHLPRCRRRGILRYLQRLCDDARA